jgi:hypothetical protein
MLACTFDDNIFHADVSNTSPSVFKDLRITPAHLI